MKRFEQGYWLDQSDGEDGCLRLHLRCAFGIVLIYLGQFWLILVIHSHYLSQPSIFLVTELLPKRLNLNVDRIGMGLDVDKKSTYQGLIHDQPSCNPQPVWVWGLTIISRAVVTPVPKVYLIPPHLIDV